MRLAILSLSQVATKQLAVDMCLTHCGWVAHICVSELTIIGSDNGLLPGRRQAIIWTNDGILIMEHLGTNFSEIFIGIHAFLFKKMHLKMSSAKWCLGLNVLMIIVWIWIMTHTSNKMIRITYIMKLTPQLLNFILPSVIKRIVLYQLLAIWNNLMNITQNNCEKNPIKLESYLQLH